MPSGRGGRQILRLHARKIRGHVVRDVRCAGHGRNAQEARAGALDLVPGVRAERGCYVGRVEGRIDLEVTLGLCNPVSAGQRLLTFARVCALTAL